MLLPRLVEQHRQAEAAIHLAQWRADYDKLKIDRDALAPDLREVYPIASAAIADVFALIAAYNRRASEVLQTRPASVKGNLLEPELLARGLDGFSRDQPWITCELRMPNWGHSNQLIWPAPSTPASVLVAQAMPTDHPRYSSDRAEAQKRDVAKRVAEEQERIKQEAALQAENRRAYERKLQR